SKSPGRSRVGVSLRRVQTRPVVRSTIEIIRRMVPPRPSARARVGKSLAPGVPLPFDRIEGSSDPVAHRAAIARQAPAHGRPAGTRRKEAHGAARSPPLEGLGL